ncbi:MAG: DsrE family protein [Candidatus Hodarchaeales archaeon]
MEKKIIVILTRPPAGRIHVVEGVRIAVGLTLEDHEVRLLFTGDSVFALRKEFQVKDKLLSKYFESFDGTITIDSEAMRMRGISQDDLIEDTVLLDSNEIANAVEESDHVITF